MGLANEYNVLVANGELGLVDDHSFRSRVLNDDSTGDTFADGADQLDVFDLGRLFNRGVDLVEDVLASGFDLERASQFVDSGAHGHEVELVVLRCASADIEGVSTADEKTWVFVAFDLEVRRESLGLAGPVLHRDDDVLRAAGLDRLVDGVLDVGLGGDTAQRVEEGGAVGQREEEAALVGDVFHVFGIGLLLLGRHKHRSIRDFVVGCSLSRDNQRLLAAEVAGWLVLCAADGRVDGPLLVFGVGD